MDGGSRHYETIWQSGVGQRRERLERGLSADAAARCGEEVPLQTRRIDVDLRLQFNPYYVRSRSGPAGGPQCWTISISSECRTRPSANRNPAASFDITARRAHSDRDTPGHASFSVPYPRRISSGSSTARRSRSCDPAEPFILCTATSMTRCSTKSDPSVRRHAGVTDHQSAQRAAPLAPPDHVLADPISPTSRLGTFPPRYHRGLNRTTGHWYTAALLESTAPPDHKLVGLQHSAG